MLLCLFCMKVLCVLRELDFFSMWLCLFSVCMCMLLLGIMSVVVKVLIFLVEVLMVLVLLSVRVGLVRLLIC